MPTPSLDAHAIERLRNRFLELDYTVAGVRKALGDRAHAALARNETTPGLRATSSGGALEILIRLWPLQVSVPRSDADEALPSLVDPLILGGFLRPVELPDGDRQVIATADIRPYGDDDTDWWVAADLTPGMDGRLAPVDEQHVLGVNSAATTLAQITVRPNVESAFDLGTGCGVEVLHLSKHARRMVATDLSQRALAFARITADLNRIEVDLRHGSLFDPVKGEEFDLVVSNPPFVVSPGKGHVYRDSGIPGDEVSRRVLVDGAVHLTPGGYLQVLANWVHVGGSPWQDRVRTWVEGTGCDAWVVEREVQDPAQYVELWLRDSGEVATADYPGAYGRWLDWFDEHHVEGIGFGWVTLRRPETPTDDLRVRIEAWPHAIQMPLGATIEDYFERLRHLRRLSDEELSQMPLTVADDVLQEQSSQPGADDPEHLVLRQQHGFRRARSVTTEQAGLVGACDGNLTLDQIIRALADLLDDDVAELRDDLVPFVREVVEEGFLVFPAPPGDGTE